VSSVSRRLADLLLEGRPVLATTPTRRVAWDPQSGDVATGGAPGCGVIGYARSARGALLIAQAYAAMRGEPCGYVGQPLVAGAGPRMVTHVRHGAVQLEGSSVWLDVRNIVPSALTDAPEAM